MFRGESPQKRRLRLRAERRAKKKAEKKGPDVSFHSVVLENVSRVPLRCDRKSDSIEGAPRPRI